MYSYQIDTKLLTRKALKSLIKIIACMSWPYEIVSDVLVVLVPRNDEDEADYLFDELT